MKEIMNDIEEFLSLNYENIKERVMHDLHSDIPSMFSINIVDLPFIICGSFDKDCFFDYVLNHDYIYLEYKDLVVIKKGHLKNINFKLSLDKLGSMIDHHEYNIDYCIHSNFKPLLSRHTGLSRKPYYKYVN